MALKQNQWQRVIDLSAGRMMIVTDLHGDWDAYQRYRDCFLRLQAQGLADYFVLNGDLIHHPGSEAEDQSLAMVLDVLALKQALGDRLIYLLGNHEFPHIYSITLQKGSDLFTPRFEHAMLEHREAIISLFKSLPLYVRTAAGVTICHAGATSAIGEADAVRRLFNFSHEAVWERARAKVTTEERPNLMRAMREHYQRTYNEMARTFLAVTGIDDPRYDDFLIGSLALDGDSDFDLLWSALFTRNEKEYGDHTYMALLTSMLKALSLNFRSQAVMVTGHIDCRGGYKLIGQQQLRLASAKHAHPREAGQYLLLDSAKKVKTAVELLPHLDTVFQSAA